MPSTPTNLPVDWSSFVGRRQESAEVRRLVAADRLVTLTGHGGVGKTRLALRAARDVLGSFPDGVWLVELAALRDGDGDGEDVAHAVADVLGLRSNPGEPLRDGLSAHLSGRKALLVLDNCEHVIARTALLVHDLLRRCPALHVLATSREPLGLAEEHVLAVPPLPFPGRTGAATPETLLHYDSVRLFVERAAASDTGFTLTPHNADAVVEICSALEGIPLAIELAAVRVRGLPLEVILERLKDRSCRPAPGVGRSPGHHRTLRASVEWSHDLCTDRERALWARLSAFAGGFDLAAAHAVCATPEEPPEVITDAVASLVEKSILTFEPSPTGRRYRMLETLREFGEERLAALKDGDAVRRHATWFVALAENAATSWLGPDQPALLARLHDEYGNLRAAFARSLARPERASGGALAIAAALEHYWLIRGWLSEGRQWLDEALAQCPDRTVERARALSVDAYLTALQGEPAVAAGLVAEARAIAAERDDRVELAHAAMIDGVIALSVGRLAEGRELVAAAVAGFRSAGHDAGEAYALCVEIALAAATEDTALAEAGYRRCVELTAPRQERHLRAFALWGRGLAALRAGDVARARDLGREALRLKHSLGDQLGMVLCLEALAWTAVVQGDDTRAGALLGACERLWSPMRMTVGSVTDFGRFRAEYEGILAARLGRRRFEAALQRGARLTVEQMLALALGEDGPGPAPASVLTPREEEIADLVAQGLTNRRIAQDLTLSPRTVEGHVEKIMGKLGFTSRTQIAAWVAERRAREP